MGSAISPDNSGGGAPSGAAGGSLTGTYPNPGLVPASALVPGSLSIADFNKLATIGTGAGIAVAFQTAIIDLTATGTHVVCIAMPFRFRLVSAFFDLVTVGGTRSVAPTINGGSEDPTYVNMYASQVGSATNLTQAARTAGGWGTAVSPNPLIDLTTSGFKVVISAGMTGVAPVCTGRYCALGQLIPVD